MSSELSPNARQLLERAKAAQMHAPKGMKVRVKSVVLANAAAQSAAAQRQTPWTNAAHWLPKPWVSGVLIVLAGGLSMLGVRSEPRMPRAAPPAAIAPSTSAESAAPPSAAETSAPPLPPTAAKTATPTPPPAAPATVTPSASPAAESPRGRSKRGNDLRAEMAWLARAEADLREGDADSALRELRAGRVRFAHSQLQAERQGLELIAQCMLGRDVSAALAKYIANTPDGVLVPRVQHECSVRGSRTP